MIVKQNTISGFFLLFFSGLFLASCGVVRTTTVSEEAKDLLGTGTASWYGPNFHGKRTANGEIYNMDDLTAAHRTLPFNTIVQVENLGNGKTVVVRINDRGPYIGNRIIDLSRRAARDLDMISTGTASVHILLMEEGDRPVNTQNSSSRETYTVQIASFQSENEARATSNRIEGTRVERVNISGRIVYRVYYGTYQNINDARQSREILAARGITGFVKQAEN